MLNTISSLEKKMSTGDWIFRYFKEVDVSSQEQVFSSIQEIET
jgi:hypothetical protein